MSPENCSPFPMADAVLIQSIEVTYSDYIESVYVTLLNDKYNAFWGNKNSVGQTVIWEFDEEWQPIGFQGTIDPNGIISISPIAYSMDCAERTLGYEIVPLGQAYNDDPRN